MYVHTFEKTHPLSERGQEQRGKSTVAPTFTWDLKLISEREQKSSIRAWRSLGTERGQALRLETGSTGDWS